MSGTTDETPIIITSANRFGADVADPDFPVDDPMALLGLWLPENEDELRPLMTLSTLGLDGYPDSRHLLLSAFDGEALYFHTSTKSRKVAEIDADPRVGLALVWVEIGRQLTVAGDAVLLTGEEAAIAYRARSRYLQLLAWVSSDEVAALPRDERLARWNDFAAAHPEEPLEAPETWTGYKVIPRRLTFWRGDAEGPSTRVEYTRTGDGWTVERIAG